MKSETISVIIKVRKIVQICKQAVPLQKQTKSRYLYQQLIIVFVVERKGMNYP